MKKFLVSLLAMLIACCVFCFPMAQAEQETTGILISREVEYLEDGSKIVTCVYEDISNQRIATAATVTKSGSKTQTAYDSDGDVLYTLTVHGTFSVVTGSSATCTASSYSYTAPGSGWSLKTGSATKSANKATANGTFVKKVLGITTQTKTASVTLTCSTSGTLS